MANTKLYNSSVFSQFLIQQINIDKITQPARQSLESFCLNQAFIWHGESKILLHLFLFFFLSKLSRDIRSFSSLLISSTLHTWKQSFVKTNIVPNKNLVGNFDLIWHFIIGFLNYASIFERHRAGFTLHLENFIPCRFLLITALITYLGRFSNKIDKHRISLCQQYIGSVK